MELTAAIERLPSSIAKAAADALHKEHQANRKDLVTVWHKISTEFDEIDERHRLAAALDRDALMKAFDERFQWLLIELSDRLVVFGNELARIERRVTTGNIETPATNGHGEQHTVSPG